MLNDTKKDRLFRIPAKVWKRHLIKDVSFRFRRVWQRLHKYPNDVVIETASVCNLRCTICRSVKADLGRQHKFMPLALFKKIVDDLVPICGSIGVSYCGEPLLNKEIFAMIRYASDKRMLVSMLTNGVLLNTGARMGVLDSGLHFMAISMDGATKDTYEAIRVGASFERLVENIRSLVKERNLRGQASPSIDLQMVVTKRNIYEIDTFERLARSLGVERAYLKSLHIDRSREEEDLDFVKGLEANYFVDSAMLPSRYAVDEGGRLALKDKGECPQGVRSPVITADGNVLPCCFDIFGEHGMGNVADRKFLDIWNSPKYVHFRHTLAMQRKLPMCGNCLPSNYKKINKVLF